MTIFTTTSSAPKCVPVLLSHQRAQAYMHSRMRHRVAEFLKVLNRAKPEQNTATERKTATCVARTEDDDLTRAVVVRSCVDDPCTLQLLQTSFESSPRRRRQRSVDPVAAVSIRPSSDAHVT